MIMRSFAVALLASTALSTIAAAQSAQPPPVAEPIPAAAAPPAAAPAAKAKDFGTVYSKAPEVAKPAPVAKPDVAAKVQDDAPAPKRKKKVVDDAFKKSAPVSDAPVASTAPAGTANGLPLSTNAAVGTKAPIGSAPALAISQQPIDSFQPASVVSDKVLRDVVTPVGDYNEAGKFTPGFYSNNINGPLGDSKSGWRGFKDGQFNVTFDGIPFGDANDPSHHSAAYFPAAFIGGVIIDRGPGSASQIGYATFGGTMSLLSRDLADKVGTEIEGSYGNFGTYSGAVTQQTGLIGGTTRAMAQYSFQKTDGALRYGNVEANQFLLKLDTKINDNWKLTLFGTTGYEDYNAVKSVTFSQLKTLGRQYGEINGNPRSEDYFKYNDSEKRTDMIYANLEGNLGYGITVTNKAYTYAYDYPVLQNNAFDQTQDGSASISNGGTQPTFSVTNPLSTCPPGTTQKNCVSKVTYKGVVDGDVTGYKQINNYRAWGDTIDLKRKVDAGFASGEFRTGFWFEHIDNHRRQKYFDYTQGVYYDQLNPTYAKASDAGTTKASQAAFDLGAAGYRLNLESHITNTQFYFEYEWKPLAGLSITPGVKRESFEREHNAYYNQTTLQPANFTKTYDATLPFLSVSAKLTPEWTVYGQASKGFLAPPVAAYYVYNFDANDIRPETTTNLQTGVVYKTRDFSVGADVYKISSKDASSTVTDNNGTQYLISNQNVLRQGVEFQGTYALGNKINLNGLGVFASAALMQATITNGANNGLAYQNTPNYTYAGGPVFDNGTFFGSFLYKAVGAQYGGAGQLASSAAANAALNKVGSYSSSDAVAGVRVDAKKWFGFGEKAEIKFGVQNIFDNHSIVDIGGTPGAKQLSDADPASKLSYTSQAGRFMYMGAKVNF